jgi:hypothetical protein
MTSDVPGLGEYGASKQRWSLLRTILLAPQPWWHEAAYDNRSVVGQSRNLMGLMVGSGDL